MDNIKTWNPYYTQIVGVPLVILKQDLSPLAKLIWGYLHFRQETEPLDQLNDINLWKKELNITPEQFHEASSELVIKGFADIYGTINEETGDITNVEFILKYGDEDE